ncbi:MAG: DEAD/DEAH box helicase [Wenyingzhuangia sp.]|jgi:ATP-dependent RNA helicase RhlE|uniref:DEAD/DEAH box helicase n=1 Tax=Wenyingzhuangia sp. TaxID=1964193 RepID=UPI00321AE2BD
MTFESLGLSEAIVKAINKKGYTKPSPIQQKAIPHILQGKDVLASAQTGTGKTAGFTLPLLHSLSTQNKWKRRPIRALVLTPTRELAAQVYDNVREYSEFLEIKSAVIFGGVKPKPQITTLRRGVDVLVATPGRLLDLISQEALSLSKIEILVLDEADRMLDMGFLRDIKKVLALVPNERQNLLFSATFSPEIKALANTFMKSPVEVASAPQNTTAEKVKQTFYNVNKGDKPQAIIGMIKSGNWSQVLVFTRTKHGANKLADRLVKSGVTAAAIHGNKSQAARTRALDGFKKNSVRVLVATDIAARGLDIPLLPHVINYELPNVPEDYVHRIGRTGRAGASGEAISLVCGEEIKFALSIEKLLGIKLPMQNLAGFDFKAPTAEELKAMKKGPSRTNSPKATQRPKKKAKPGEAPKWVQGKRNSASKLGRSRNRR